MFLTTCQIGTGYNSVINASYSSWSRCLVQTWRVNGKAAQVEVPAVNQEKLQGWQHVWGRACITVASQHRTLSWRSAWPALHLKRPLMPRLSPPLIQMRALGELESDYNRWVGPDSLFKIILHLMICKLLSGKSTDILILNFNLFL